MHYSNTHWNYESNFEEEQGRWAKIQNSLLDSIIKKMKAETLQKTDPERPLSPQWQHSLELLNSSLISVFLGKKMIAKSCHIYSFSFCWLTLGQFRIFFFPPNKSTSPSKTTKPAVPISQGSQLTNPEGQGAQTCINTSVHLPLTAYYSATPHKASPQGKKKKKIAPLPQWPRPDSWVVLNFLLTSNEKEKKSTYINPLNTLTVFQE